MFLGLFAGVSRRVTLGGAGAFDERHVHRYLNFEHVHAILRFREFLHTARNDLGLFTGIFDAFFVGTFLVADELEEKGHIGRRTLRTDAFNPGVLGFVDWSR